MKEKDKGRVVIENIKPKIDCGRFPIKRVVGENVAVTADIFADGHDAVFARIRYRRQGDREWREAPMKGVGNDRWMGEFVVEEAGVYHYLVEGWIDHFKTWQGDLRKKFEAGHPLSVDIRIGARYVEEASERASPEDRERLLKLAEVLKKEAGVEETASVAIDKKLTAIMEKYPDPGSAVSSEEELSVVVDRKKAIFSAWYEFFPRSCSSEPGKHGTLADCEELLTEIAGMGFDILYLPPVHPIGETNRKGKNNSLVLLPGDVGSPWAVGSKEGGHQAIHPQLGTLDDFDRLVRRAKDYGIEIALDLAFQCSPDHSYLRDHPEWFRWRPDGTIQYAENPPKKYEDIIPFYFETEKWTSLWDELKAIPLFWMERGIRIFRVDNPHTKPLAFWEWLIQEVKKKDPGVIFFSEAFTRPKVMYRLAKAGFGQSYTYFTWRNSKRELIEYLTELTQTEVREYFRPNFWPNTPDILPEPLQYGGRSAFMIRLVLAATLGSNYGIYGPAFELCVNEAIPGTEDYLHSEKYELKHWDRGKAGNLRDFISKVNRIRRENIALQTLWNLSFCEVDNDSLLSYSKVTEDLSDMVLVVVNLDPFHKQSGWLRIPLAPWGIDPAQPYLVHDLLNDDKYIWQGEKNFVELNPQVLPAAIFRIRKRIRRETDFDYFM